MSEQVYVVTDLPQKASRFPVKKLVFAAATVAAVAVIAKLAKDASDDSDTSAEIATETATA